MKQFLLYLLAAGLLLPLSAPRAAAQGGGVTGVKATFASCRMEVRFELTSAAPRNLTLWYSADLGQTYHRCDSVQGDLTGQTTGSKVIFWDCFAEEIRWGAIKCKVTVDNANDCSSDFIEMVAVEGGTFTMGCTAEQGSDCFDYEKPSHSVTVSSFCIGKYEVTQAQWVSVMGSNPSYFKGDDLPVEQVSWDDVQAFITKLNTQTGKQYRLPTEAEWEYAARGGAQSKGYKYSGSSDVGAVAWYSSNSGSATHAVGGKQENELGIHDMSGNVWEWCSDWYGEYSSSPLTDPTGPTSGSYRVGRGGHWNNAAAYCRVAYRDYISPSNRSSYFGFRLACSSN
jgi:formylglycine-generating enzyme required for sulfatase activity